MERNENSGGGGSGRVLRPKKLEFTEWEEGGLYGHFLELKLATQCQSDQLAICAAPKGLVIKAQFKRRTSHVPNLIIKFGT